MRWYIVRHAEKEKGDFYHPGLRHQDQPLSLKGRITAQRLNSFFRDKSPKAIYVSAYQRTRQTIEPVANRWQIEPVVDERLNEVDNGLLEGLSDEDICKQYPDVWKAYQEQTADFRFPEGETGEEAQQRIVNFLEEKQQENSNGYSIIVSHDGLIRLLMCYLLDMPVYKRWRFRVDPGAIMEIEYNKEQKAWQLISFNRRCR